MDTTKTQSIFFFVLLASVLGFFLYLISPYAGAFAITLTLSIIFRPLYRDVLKMTRGRSWLASLITLIMIVIIVGIPLGFLLFNMLGELQQMYSGLTQISTNTNSFSQLTTQIATYQQKYLPWLSVNFSALKSQVITWMLASLSDLFNSAFKIIIDIVIILMGIFYLLKDGSKFKKYLIKLSPLKEKDDISIIERIERTIGSVVQGSLLVGIIQGILVGVGFTIFGIPQPIFWGTIAAMAAMVPSVGTALITVPAILYLAAIGQYLPALGLLIWSLTLVHVVDGIVGPFLVGRKAIIHPFFIFLSVIGGLSFFGPIGFILGPIILSLGLALLDIYSTTPEIKN